MKLTNVLSELKDITIQNESDVEITNVHSDSRKIKEGGLFVAVNGYKMNGTDFIPNAIENGAKAIIVEKNNDISHLNISSNIPIIFVENARYALAITSSTFYDNPSKKFK